MNRIRLVGFFLLIISFFACENKMDYEGKTIFRYNISEGITSLDPAFARSIQNVSAIHQLFNGLIQMDDQLNIIPCIAKRWEITDSSRTYTFYLRDDVFFHDDPLFGDQPRKVLADDFVYSFQRLVDERLSTPGAWVLNQVARDANGMLMMKSLSDSVLQIQLKEAFPPFLGILGMKYCSVVPKEIVEHYGADFRSHPVGTGPFRFQYWKEGNKLIFLKNEQYFEVDDKGQSLPYLDAVAISFTKDEEVSFLNFVKGELDFLNGLNGSYKDEILDSKGRLRSKYQGDIRLITQAYLNTEYLGFLVDSSRAVNAGSPILNKKVRQAINYGFDRQKMLTYLRNGIGTAATSGFVPKGLPSFKAESVKGYAYDPRKAAALLEEAGYPNGDGMPEITLSTTAQYVDLCEYIQHQLGTIGISLQLEVNPPATSNELIAQSELNFFRKSWVADYPDAENYLSLFYSKNFAPKGPNYTHFSNPAYDRLYEASLSITNDSLRYRLYQQMDSIVIEEAAVVPLFYDQVVRFVRKDIEGLGVNAMNLIELKAVKKNIAKTN